MSDDKSTRKDGYSKNTTTVKLSAPWGGSQKMTSKAVLLAKDSNSEAINNFVEERTEIHEIYIRENAKSKRLGLILSFILILLSALIVAFSPEGRETLSYWIGGALIVFSAGASGFGRVWGKAANFSFGADQDRRDL